MANFVKADLDDMVFEDREKRYGAYDLRTQYPRHLAISTLIASVLALLVAFGPMIAEKLFPSDGEAGRVTKAITINMEDLPPPPPLDEEVPPPPPPPDLPPPKIKKVEFRMPKPVPPEQAEEDATMKQMEELEDQDLGSFDQEGEENSPFKGIVEEGNVPEAVQYTEPNPNDFVFAEEEPKPVNMDDVRKLIGYPQMARDAGIEGVVVMRVLVSKRGKYKKHRIVQQGHSMLSAAVAEHISRLKFTPAIQGGKPIEFWVNIPFNFKLIE